MLEEVKAGTWKPVADALKQAKVWAYYDQTDKEDSFTLKHWVAINEKTTCGFSACAMGHATLDARFRKLGLRFSKDSYLEPAFNESVNIEATSQLFDITEETARLLFTPDEYPPHLTEKNLINQVIRRIKKLIQIGEVKFFEKFELYANIFLIKPDLRVYNY